MTPQSAKAKGRRLQQWVRDQIISHFTQLSKDDVRSTSMGAGGADVLLSAVGKKRFPYEIECKNKKEIAVYGWYAQAQAHGELEPLLVIKTNNEKPLVVVDAVHFFELVRRANENKHGTEGNCSNPGAV